MLGKGPRRISRPPPPPLPRLLSGLGKQSSSGTLAAPAPPEDPINPPFLPAEGQELRGEGRDGRQLQGGAARGGPPGVHGLPAPALRPPPVEEPPDGGGGAGPPGGAGGGLPPAGAAPHRDARRDGFEDEHRGAGRPRAPPAPRHEQEGKDRDVRRGRGAQLLRAAGVRLRQAAGQLQVLAAPRVLRHPRGRGRPPRARRRHRGLPAAPG